jgi:hypothetical protein
MLTELLAFLDELLSYVESVRDIHGEDGRSARRSPAIERLTHRTRACAMRCRRSANQSLPRPVSRRSAWNQVRAVSPEV